MHIIRATLAHAAAIAPLFDAYRQFYKAPSDLAGARQFIAERLERDESVIFLALEEEQALGFVQLYPTFASVAMQRLWLLNDLFVEPGVRKQGVGVALMQQAEVFARETGSRGLFLRTALDNETAQRLYERCGWTRDSVFVRYDKLVSS
ncbi:MAG: GNAT family N-acetyltransferase [Chloroflexaceae bacterium]|jgi:GNAT superfamily N-acetyltransferase|nr:GNAT family N-acetyltransferase [Chloroflexaceae bacterium]